MTLLNTIFFLFAHPLTPNGHWPAFKSHSTIRWANRTVHKFYSEPPWWLFNLNTHKGKKNSVISFSSLAGIRDWRPPWAPSRYLPVSSAKQDLATLPCCRVIGLNRRSPPSSLASFVVAQSLSCVQLFVTLWTAACQASLFFIISWCLHKLVSVESMMPSNHLHSLSSPSPAPSLSLHQGLFQWVSSLHQVAKILELQPQHLSF